MKDYRVYLLHIRDAIQSIRKYTIDGRESFLHDEKTQDAAIRQLEIIGETIELPWKKIAGMRDKIIHEYFGVDLKIVWDVVVTEVTELEQAVNALLSTRE